MALLSVSEAREHVETDLTDSALSTVIDAQDQEITFRLGEISSQVDRLEPGPGSKVIYPTRRIDTVTEIKEKVYPSTDLAIETETTLSADDYEVVDNGRRVDRLPQGTNPRTYWGDVITLTYTPYDDTKRRKRALIELIKLHLAYEGVLSERLPDYQYDSFEDYRAQMERIIFGAAHRWFA